MSINEKKVIDLKVIEKKKETPVFSSGLYHWMMFLINFYNRVKKDLKIDFDSFMILQLVVSDNLYKFNKDGTKNFKELEDTFKDYESLLNVEKKEEIKEEMNEIPEDYLDPITNELIKEVVILPSSKKKMDMTVIKKHLLYHNFDPFNREELSLEKLIEYNECIEIKKECEEFMNDINDWESKFL